MPHAIWKGHVSFGLVTIPVAMYPAENAQARLRFHLLDRRDMSPVRQQRVNERTGEEVAWDDVVHGYAYGDDTWVVLSDDELKAANPEASQTIDIVGTVCTDDVDVVFFDKPYYLEPAPSGRKAYALLREALEGLGRAAVARVVIRTKEHLALLVPRGPALVLEMLRYDHELRDVAALDIPPLDRGKSGVTDAELKMARMLLDSIAGTWDPSAYHDDYYEDVMALIESKAAGGEIAKLPEPPAEESAGGEVVDMMALLKASVERADGKPGGRRRGSGKGGSAAAGSA
jgi:DNA end-binding protein Ku